MINKFFFEHFIILELKKIKKINKFLFEIMILIF
jgi:hypothetical protein